MFLESSSFLLILLFFLLFFSEFYKLTIIFSSLIFATLSTLPNWFSYFVILVYISGLLLIMIYSLIFLKSIPIKTQIKPQYFMTLVFCLLTLSTDFQPLSATNTMFWFFTSIFLEEAWMILLVMILISTALITSVLPSGKTIRSLK